MPEWFSLQQEDPVDPTPWATRYARRENATATKSGKRARWQASGLNPIWPRLDPINIADWREAEEKKGEEVGQTRPSNMYEWDHLFRTERTQTNRLIGLKSWQLSAWWRAVGGRDLREPGTYLGDTFILHDHELPKVWRREQWRDNGQRIHDCPGFQDHWIPDLDENEIFSVDNPRVWNALRPVLELASRLLQMLCYLNRARPL